MFGLESGTSGAKKNKNEAHYDLEMDMKDPKKSLELQKKLEERTQEIRNYQRAGKASKDQYFTIGRLLLGYDAAMKVLTRFKQMK